MLFSYKRLHNLNKSLFLLFQSISVQTLIHEAYSKYGFLTIGGIERLRLKHRLRVVQNLEEGIEKNIIKSISNEKLMTAEELQVDVHIIAFLIH